MEKKGRKGKDVKRCVERWREGWEGEGRVRGGRERKGQRG